MAARTSGAVRAGDRDGGARWRAGRADARQLSRAFAYDLTEHAQSARWRGQLAHLLHIDPVARAADYFDWLSPQAAQLDIWTTEYLQVLPANAEDEHPVASWTRGTWLSPLLAALYADEQTEFLAYYSAQLRVAYPPLADGRVLFPFRRLFIVANR